MVNTFLVYPLPFSRTFKKLDFKRLGKQRVEALQILNVLTKLESVSLEDMPCHQDKIREFIHRCYWHTNALVTYKTIEKKNLGFVNHPAVHMWIGYTDALKQYINECIAEWISRGYKNTMVIYDLPHDIEYPYWINSIPLHKSNMASLYRKDKDIYSSFHKRLGAYEHRGYIWPSSLSYNESVIICNKKLTDDEIKSVTCII